jgi:hypothetical protein
VLENERLDVEQQKKWWMTRAGRRGFLMSSRGTFCGYETIWGTLGWGVALSWGRSRDRIRIHLQLRSIFFEQMKRLPSSHWTQIPTSSYSKLSSAGAWTRPHAPRSLPN